MSRQFSLQFLVPRLMRLFLSEPLKDYLLLTTSCMPNLLQPNLRERVSLSSLSPKQTSHSLNNGRKLFIALLKTFAITVQCVVQSFAKELFVPNYRHCLFRNFLLLLLKVALFLGKTL